MEENENVNLNAETALLPLDEGTIRKRRRYSGGRFWEGQSNRRMSQVSSDSYFEQSMSLGSRPHQSKVSFAKPGLMDYNFGRSKDNSIRVTDEVFNAGSHLIGAMISLLASVWLIVKSSVIGNAWGIVSFSIYAFGAVGLFTASFLHHGVHIASLDHIFRLIDYAFIYIMIAGTYTPICLVFLHHCWRGWAYFGIVWGLGLLGVTLNVSFGDLMPKWLIVTWFLGMGGVGVVFCSTVFQVLGRLGSALVIGGSLSYVAGSVIFMIEKPNPIKHKFGFHEIFHLLVLFGAIIHQFMLYIYVLPYDGEGRCPSNP